MPRRLLVFALLSPAALADPEPAWRPVSKTSFVFGCADEVATAGKKPAPTKVPALWMTPARITAEQYQQCVAHGGCKPVPSMRWCNTAEPTWPATCVSYPEAERYCRWVGGRVPTAVEWESFADSGFDMNSGDGVDDAHGATEWVADGKGLLKGYEETRGGVPDLEPQRRCVGGNAISNIETGSLGFRCVRATPPPPFRRRPVEAVKRTLRGFTLVGGRVVLAARLSDDELAHTFVGCNAGVQPLGAYVATSTEPGEWGPATRHSYATPCQEVVFVITAPDVRAGPIRELGRGPRFGEATFKACRASSGDRVVEVPGSPSSCQVRLAGDLNDDGVADFLVETRDVCTAGVLLLSAGDTWLVAARDDLWCPD